MDRRIKTHKWVEISKVLRVLTYVVAVVLGLSLVKCDSGESNRSDESSAHDNRKETNRNSEDGNPGTHGGQEIVAVEKKDFPVQEFCNFLESEPSREEARDFIQNWQEENKDLSTGNFEKIIQSTCYRDMYLKPKAEELCDCINRYGQVSLDCDDIHIDIEQNFDSAEKEIIESIFVSMNCLDE